MAGLRTKTPAERRRRKSAGRLAGNPMRAQRGAALTALMLMLVLGSGLAGMGWLEAKARSAHVAARTEAALAAARDALIGYAASYPDQHSGRHGPGYLPCPDTSGNGSPNTPCRRKSLGRLPWRRLGLHDPRDGTGERLWYALADRFRANGHKHRPLNGETVAELTIDGRDGFAAVVLAPGRPLASQDRTRGRFDPAQYLEGGNETPADGAYVSFAAAPPGGGRPNDRVAAIARDELMAAAGRRVLAETRALLEAYRGAPWNTGALPWPAPWGGAADGAPAVPGAFSGRLPLARTGHAVATSFRVAGAPAGGAVAASGTVDAAAAGLPAHPLTVPAGRCEWTDAGRIDCEGEARVPLGAGRERVYRLALHFTGDAAVTPPAPADVRRRSVRGRAWSAESRIEVRDRSGGVETGRGEVRFAPGPVRGRIEVAGVAYPLGVGGEMPQWMVENEWHRSLLVGFAPAFTAGGGALCAAPGDCLEVVRTSLYRTGGAMGGPRRAAAVSVLAGAALAHQRRTGTPGVPEWFEGENASPADLLYEAREPDGSFNDLVAVLAP